MVVTGLPGLSLGVEEGIMCLEGFATLIQLEVVFTGPPGLSPGRGLGWKNVIRCLGPPRGEGKSHGCVPL